MGSAFGLRHSAAGCEPGVGFGVKGRGQVRSIVAGHVSRQAAAAKVGEESIGGLVLHQVGSRDDQLVVGVDRRELVFLNSGQAGRRRPSVTSFSDFEPAATR